MKNLTKKLFISVLSLLLVLVALGTSTFAWFTLGTEAEIDNVRVNVTTGTGMEISKDGKSWVNKITLADNEVAFKDLTSANGIAINAMNSTAATDDDYLTLTFYVRLTKNTNGNPDYSNVLLKTVTGSDKNFTSNSDKWLADVTFTGKTGDLDNENQPITTTYTQGNYYNFDALNAVKVSFQANAATSAKVFAYENDNNQGDAIYDGISKAYAEAKEYSIPASATLPTYIKQVDLTTGNAAAATAEEKAAISVLVDTDFGVFSTLNLTNVTGDDTNYVYAKLTVRVWLEGWDADCINAILEQKTTFSFILEAK